MACESTQYEDITEPVMAGIRRGLAAMDMALPEGNQGVLRSNAYNVSARFDFQPESKTLTVEVTEKPFFVPCSYIYKKVGEAVDRARNHS